MAKSWKPKSLKLAAAKNTNLKGLRKPGNIIAGTLFSKIVTLACKKRRSICCESEMFRKIQKPFLNRNKVCVRNWTCGQTVKHSLEMEFPQQCSSCAGALRYMSVSYLHVRDKKKKLSRAAMMIARAALCNSSQVRSLLLLRGAVTITTKWTRHLTRLSAAMKFLTFI